MIYFSLVALKELKPCEAQLGFSATWEQFPCIQFPYKHASPTWPGFNLLIANLPFFRDFAIIEPFISFNIDRTPVVRAPSS